MAVTRLGAATDAAGVTTHSHTVGSGTDRILVVGIGWGQTASGVASVDYGGQPMVLAAENVHGGGRGSSVWYLLDAGIGAASGTTITPTWSGGAPSAARTFFFASGYEGVNQGGGASTLTATAADEAGTSNPITTIDVTETADGFVYSCIWRRFSTTGVTWAADMSAVAFNDSGGRSAAVADRLSTTSGNVDIEPTWDAAPDSTGGVSAAFAPSDASAPETVQAAVTGSASASAAGAATVKAAAGVSGASTATAAGRATTALSAAVVGSAASVVSGVATAIVGAGLTGSSAAAATGGSSVTVAASITGSATAAAAGKPRVDFGGVVTDANGDPVAGIGADLFSEGRVTYLTSTTTAADGSYSFSVIDDTCYVVTLIAPIGETWVANGTRFIDLADCAAGSDIDTLNGVIDATVLLSGSVTGSASGFATGSAEATVGLAVSAAGAAGASAVGVGTATLSGSVTGATTTAAVGSASSRLSATATGGSSAAAAGGSTVVLAVNATGGGTAAAGGLATVVLTATITGGSTAASGGGSTGALTGAVAGSASASAVGNATAVLSAAATGSAEATAAGASSRTITYSVAAIGTASASGAGTTTSELAALATGQAIAALTGSSTATLAAQVAETAGAAAVGSGGLPPIANATNRVSGRPRPANRYIERAARQNR